MKIKTELKEQNNYLLSKYNKISLKAMKISSGFTLFLDFSFNKKRVKEYLKMAISTMDKKKMTIQDKEILLFAEKVAAKRFLELESGLYGLKKKGEDHNFSEYFKAIVQDKVYSKDKSIYKWTSALKHFYIYTDNKDVMFSDLDAPFFEGYRKYLLGSIKQNTASGYYQILNQVLNQAVNDNIIDYNNMNRVKKITRQQTGKVFLVLDEIKIFEKTKASSESSKNAFLFCCFTGLRYSDVKALTWKNLHKEGRDYYIYFKQKKTDKEQRLLLNKNALKYIGEIKSGNNPIFEPLLTKKRVNEMLKRITESAGINKHITFHCSRHTFATLALTYGVGIKTVSELLGHSEVRTTEIYAKIIDGTKDEAMLKLPSF